LPFTSRAQASGSSRFRPPDEQGDCSSGILSWASAPLQRAQAPSRCLRALVSQPPPTPGPFRPPMSSASLEVSTPTASSPPRAAASWSGLPRPTACAFRCSQPLGASIRPEPAGLVSCRIRSWGHPPELCSSRAAVRCSQRLSPLGVSCAAFRVLLHAGVRHSTQRFRLEPSA